MSPRAAFLRISPRDPISGTAIEKLRDAQGPAKASRLMSDDTKKDWRDTVFLPKTDFPMRAGLPKREPQILADWESRVRCRWC